MKCADVTKLSGWLTLLILFCGAPVALAEHHVAAEEGSVAEESQPAPEAKKKKLFPHMPILAYTNAVTVGSSRDFVADYSPRGLALEYRYRIFTELSVGALVGVQDFREKRQGRQVFDSGAYWGTQVREMETVPLVVNVHGYWPVHKRILPFVGLDLGAYYKWRYVDFGWGWESEDNWHFGIAPQLGALFPVGPMAFLLSSKFNYLVKSGDSPEEMFVSIYFGIALME